MNILTNKYLFTPGRYYRGFINRFKWYLTNIGKILKNVQFADKELLSVFKKLLGLDENFVSIDDVAYKKYDPKELLFNFLQVLKNTRTQPKPKSTQPNENTLANARKKFDDLIKAQKAFDEKNEWDHDERERILELVDDFVKALYRTRYPDFRFENLTVHLAQKMMKNHNHNILLFYGQDWNRVDAEDHTIGDDTFDDWVTNLNKNGLPGIFEGIKRFNSGRIKDKKLKNEWKLFISNYYYDMDEAAYVYNEDDDDGGDFITGSGTDAIYFGWSPSIVDKTRSLEAYLKENEIDENHYIF